MRLNWKLEQKEYLVSTPLQSLSISLKRKLGAWLNVKAMLHVHTYKVQEVTIYSEIVFASLSNLNLKLKKIKLLFHLVIITIKALKGLRYTFKNMKFVILSNVS